MPEPSGGPPPTTPLGEAVEQAIDGLSTWCRDVAGLVQADTERMAAGTYHLADLTTVGARLLRIGVANVIRMAGVLSDNMALLSALDEDKELKQPTKPDVRVPVSLPVGKSGTIVTSSLAGLATRRPLPQTRLTVAPSTYSVDGARETEVKVTVTSDGFPRDIYAGTLWVEADGNRVGSVRYIVAVDEIAEPRVMP